MRPGPRRRHLPIRLFPAALALSAMAVFAVDATRAQPMGRRSLSVGTEGGAVVLAYSRFGDDELGTGGIRIDQFEEHLNELRTGNYTVLPLARIVRALSAGDPLPDRTVAITIDEASRSFHQLALPRLRAAGLPFTLFVSPDPLDRGTSTHMSWAELREAVSAGAGIGALPSSPVPMPARSHAENRAAILRSIERLKEELDTAPTLLAYPYGEHGASHRALTEALGLEAAFGQQSGVAWRGTDRFALPRFVMNDTFGGLERFVLAANALPLPVADVVPADPLLRQNPPAVGFTVGPVAESLDRLACFASGIGRTALERLEPDRIEIRLAEPLPPGRTRINCTLPAGEGRWRWFGMQFFVPG